MKRAYLSVLTLFLGTFAIWGCAETAFILGRGGAGLTTGGVTGTTSGGITSTGGGIPTTSQPAAIAGPTFSASLLDPLLESTAGAKAVDIGDVDNDGLLDVVSISDESQPVQIHLRNAATGLFDTLSIGGAAPLSRTRVVKLADLNADGRLDVVVMVNDTGFVPPPDTTMEGAVVLLLQGADPRNPFLWTRVVPANMRIGGDDKGFVDMAVADFDGQFGPDIVVLSNEPKSVRNVYLFPNPGPAQVADASAASWLRRIVEIDASDLARCEVADIDADGDPDLVMCVPPAKSFNVRWMRNPLVESGAAAVTAAPWSRRIVGQQQFGGHVIAVGDIDGDGALDVAAADQTDRLVQWFHNPGPVALASEIFPIPWEVFNLGTLTSGTIDQLRLVDLDQNGTLDCFLTADGNVVGFQRRATVQDWWQPFSIFATNPVAAIGRVGFNDFNGDGRLDFVAPFDRPGLTTDQFVIFARR